MIIPMIGMMTLMSFILASGFLILLLHTAWKVDLINMVFFVAGAFLTAIGMNGAMGYMTSRMSITVHPGSTVMIMLLIVFASGIVVGGYYSVSAWHRIVKKKMGAEK
jgi:hypothetical protein